jgi:hypothetical protein
MNDSILFWNAVALEAARVDFANLGSANPAEAPQQGGPTFTSRALAIAHLAMHDAYMGATGGITYLPYTAAELPAGPNVAAARVAVATAACVTLTALYSRQEASFLQRHAEFVASLGAVDDEVSLGLAWGNLVGQRMLAERANDGSAGANGAYAPSTEPYRHRADPMNPGQGFLGAQWGRVRPFCIDRLTTGKITLQPPPVPPLAGAGEQQRYADDFNAVKALGSVSSTTRTPEQTTIGIFWGYDGARNMGTPPRLYNQAVRAISIKALAGDTLEMAESKNARLFAGINAAMADAGVVAWHEKYLFNVWRPTLGIREADSGWGPSGRGDSNAGTVGDPYWTPLGAPQTNGSLREGVTPNFPAYPSGHATFGTVALELARRMLGLQPTFEFDLVSEELDGRAQGARGVRMRHVRRLTIARAIEENILSRVYLGVHWEFDGREGEAVGRQLASLIAPEFPQRITS